MLSRDCHPVDTLKRHFKMLRKQSGFCDLLSYLIQWNEDVILHKDFSLSKHFAYQPPDLSAANDQQCDHHAALWKKALQFLGDGWMVETQVISQKYHSSSASVSYPDEVSALLHEERHQQYNDAECYNTLYRLSLTWKPPVEMVQRLKHFTFSLKPQQKPGRFQALFSAFEKKSTEFINYLKKAVVNIESLKNADVITFLSNCISGGSQRLEQPDVGFFLDSYLSQYDFVAGMEPKIGNKDIAVLALDGLPTHSYPCLLQALNHLPIEYRWSSRLMSLDRHTAQQYLKRYERNWSSKAIGLVGIIRESLGLPSRLDQHAQRNVEELIHAQSDNMAGDIAHGFYTSVIVLMHEDKKILNQSIQQVTAIVQQLNFSVRQESINACEAYLGSLPSHGGYNLRKMLVDTHYMSHALPMSGFYQGEWQAPSNMSGYVNQAPLLITTTQHSRPFALNLHVSDVGHCAILGPTGSGKSTLIAMLMLGHRQYAGSRVIVFDKDYSHHKVIQALEGDYIDLTKKTSQFSPLARVKIDDLVSIDEAVNWLSECCTLQHIEITPERKQMLQQAVQRLAHEDAEYKSLNHLSVQDPTLRAALAAFNTGMVQVLLNGRHPFACHADVIGFNMGDLIGSEGGADGSSIAIIKAIFNELMVQFKDRRPTLLILEEAWLYLKHPLFLSQLTDWFKTLRKANVAVVFISQDLHDIVASSAASTIQTACMTRIYCPNKAACEPNVAAQYANFGLNERQIAQITQAMPKRDYYYQSSLGHAMFKLELGEVAQSILCSNTKQQHDRDSDWIIEHLKGQKFLQWEQWVKQYRRERCPASHI